MSNLKALESYLEELNLTDEQRKIARKIMVEFHKLYMSGDHVPPLMDWRARIIGNAAKTAIGMTVVVRDIETEHDRR